MRTSGSLMLKVAALLVPMIVGCAAQGDDAAGTAPMPMADALEASFQAMSPLLPRTDLAVRRTHTTPGGVTHVHMQQLYQGIRVFEGEVITHVDANGNVTKTDALRAVAGIDVTPTLTKDEAIGLARTAGPADGVAQVVTAELVVLPRGEHGNADRLAWYVRVFSEGGDDGAAQWDSFYDARNGKLLLAFDTLETADTVLTKGKTAFNGQFDLQARSTTSPFSLYDARGDRTCDLQNTTSGACVEVAPTSSTSVVNGDGSTTTTATWGTGASTPAYVASDRASAAADAHLGMQKTLEYYQAKFGRNSIDNKGMIAVSRVHYGSSYENAFWSDTCKCMTYGDGGSTLYPLTTLDVAAHEMSHGVMANSANLTYRGESGGLNESNSDIFGTLVEWYANSPSDTPDWDIGERLFKSSATKALRYMADPAKDGRSPACWSSKTKSLDVHYSSGANNHMFYLLAQDGTAVSKCNSKTVNGIGKDKAAAIWYRAITAYMTSSTTYAGARTAMIQAATALATERPDVFGASDVQAVKDAYTAINVL